jgi:hypothetical protein
VTASTGSGIVVGDEGDGHVVVSNAIVYTGTSSGWSCFDANLPTSSYEAVDYDLCWFPDAAGEWNDGWGTVPDGLSAWQGGSGLCAHCLDVNPGLDDGAPSETSAVVGAGHPTLSSLDDILGRPRLDPDLGAYEWTLPQDTGDTGSGKTDDTAPPVDGGHEDSNDDGGCHCGNGRLAASWLCALSGLVVLRRRR